MKPFIGDRTGFSFIELAVTLAIGSVLVAMTVPRYEVFLARFRQIEAKIHMAYIYRMVAADKMAGTYIGADNAIGLQLVGYDRIMLPVTANCTGNHYVGTDSVDNRYYYTVSDQPTGLRIRAVAKTTDNIREGCGCHDMWELSGAGIARLTALFDCAVETGPCGSGYGCESLPAPILPPPPPPPPPDPGD